MYNTPTLWATAKRLLAESRQAREADQRANDAALRSFVAGGADALRQLAAEHSGLADALRKMACLYAAANGLDGPHAPVPAAGGA
jgi:hypothetical protein